VAGSMTCQPKTTGEAARSLCCENIYFGQLNAFCGLISLTIDAKEV
jgi:hypothetical protein